MSRTNRIALWLLGAALMTGVLWYAKWFVTNFERDSKEVRTNISPEARKNRFLAAEFFLQQSGQAVQSHAGRDIFSLEPTAEDTIFLGNNSRLFFQRNHEALLEWVNAGGHLVFVLQREDEEEEKFPLLEQLGVKLVILDEDESISGDDCTEGEVDCDTTASEIQADSNTENADNADNADNAENANDEDEGEKKITAIFESTHPGEFKARFLSDRYLSDTEGVAEVAIGMDGLPNLLRFSLGAGRVTVLSDNELFSNDFIGKYDHAYLFSRITATPGKVWIFYSADMPSLLMLLWQRTPWLLLISIALLLMAGWRMLINIGPKLKLQYDQRRNLLEHLDATANYSWRIDKARRLLHDNRQAVEQAWRRRHPQLNTMDQKESCEWIGEKTGITASAVERTLFGNITTEQDFIRATSVLQRLATRVNQHAGSASTNRS